MTFSLSLSGYNLECQYMLSFFPVRANSALSVPHVRAGRITYSTDDFAIDAFKMDTVNVPEKGQDQLVLGIIEVRASFLISLNSSQVFVVQPTVFVGADEGVTRSFTLPPETTKPFMIFHPGHGELAGTAAVLNGVITTTMVRGSSILVQETKTVGP